jgi:hypothetical protein
MDSPASACRRRVAGFASTADFAQDQSVIALERV